MLRGIVRRLNSQPEGVEAIAMVSLSLETDGTVAQRSMDHVVHLAAHVHVMIDRSADPLAEF